jgi:hypothetical protein
VGERVALPADFDGRAERSCNLLERCDDSALVELAGQELVADAERYALQPGMQVAGEIHLGTRSILEYLLSAVKAFHEAARER